MRKQQKHEEEGGPADAEGADHHSHHGCDPVVVQNQ
jgi:hypothetical protein